SSSRLERKARNLPSGDQRGELSVFSEKVYWRTWRVAMSIIQMCWELFVAFGGSLTVKDKRAPSGEKRRSEMRRKFKACSGVRRWLAGEAAAFRGFARASGLASNRIANARARKRVFMMAPS